ncbi:PaaI family thioesterase [Brevundimonas sp.]|uniref:PaaI family thioesterase n=1 Tax=Brevundimonas sp. TaxID=1871086 RepID=UPI003BA9F1E1
MSEAFRTEVLPILAGGSAHTRALGFMLEGINEDRVTLRAPYRADLIGDPESQVLAGGFVTTLLDHVGGLAVWLKLNEFQPIATLDLRVDYMRAARPNQDLLAEARCYRLTKSIAFIRAWAFETSPDDPVAAAQGAYVLTGDGNDQLGANLKARTQLTGKPA